MLTLILLVHAVVLSERMVDRVKMCEIRSEIYGASDHCPIVLEITPNVAS
jgi:exonuclease III